MRVSAVSLVPVTPERMDEPGLTHAETPRRARRTDAPRSNRNVFTIARPYHEVSASFSLNQAKANRIPPGKNLPTVMPLSRQADVLSLPGSDTSKPALSQTAKANLP